MKKPYYLLLLLAVTLFSSCKKEKEDPLDKIFSFSIKNEKGFVAPEKDINGAYDLQQQFGISMPLPVSGVAGDTEADFRANNTSTNLVSAVRVNEVIMTMPDNATENFSFLEKMDIYIAMDEHGTDEMLMAFNRDIPNTNEKRLVFTPTTNSMEKYIKAGNYALILKDARLRRKVTTDLNITARITYTVTANPLK